MKKRNLLFVFCLAGIATFSSCEKNLYDESKQPQEEKRISDLDIPADFDWYTSRKAQYVISTPSATRISVYLDKACNENDLVLQMDIDQETETLPIEIPSFAKNVYVKYEGGKESLTVPVAEDGTIAITVPNDAKAPVAKAITRAGKGDYLPDGKEGLVYPGKGYGTILFEDMYPVIGDYDFNDFVARYLLQIPEFTKVRNKYFTEVMYIGFQIRAIGGIQKYDPYIHMTEVSYDDVDIEESLYIIQNRNQAEGKNIKFIKGPKGELIISFADAKPTIPEGSQYLNTEVDDITNSGEHMGAYIVFNDLTNLDKLQDSKVDIYLANENNKKEIHLKGYHPIYDSEDTGYASEKNYVWGLKVPLTIQHAIETKSFLSAYPNFEQWVTSGGKEHQGWWNQPNKEYLINLID